MTLIYRPNHPKANENGMIDRSEYEEGQVNNGPMVISDTMPLLKHAGTGKYSDSKSEHRKMTKQGGWIELGNELQANTSDRPSPKMDKMQRKDDIRRAIYELKNGRQV